MTDLAENPSYVCSCEKDDMNMSRDLADLTAFGAVAD